MNKIYLNYTAIDNLPEPCYIDFITAKRKSDIGLAFMIRLKEVLFTCDGLY